MLKRSPLRRGTKRLKTKTCLKKKSKVKISVLKRKLWNVFSKYIRTRDKGICYICGRLAMTASGYHAGHFIPKSVGGLILYFHPDNVHGSCYNCNINLGGNLYLYGQKLGKEKCDELYALKGKVLKVTPEWYLERIAHYTEEINRLNK